MQAQKFSKTIDTTCLLFYYTLNSYRVFRKRDALPRIAPAAYPGLSKLSTCGASKKDNLQIGEFAIIPI
jgi:hypothetical protein